MLKVENLNKQYPFFRLKDISFHLPKGYIMGFIGKNGAGKTTTLKSILNIVKPNNGTVEILGKDYYANEIELKHEIGFMFGAVDYYSKNTVQSICKVYSRFYNEWDENLFQIFLKRFGIDERKKISDLSAGMAAKLGIAMALSHNAKLLILDEPTSGLDPIARSELLDIFREIIEDGEKSILFSTHITSDLDKCADYIIFIRNGELFANDAKDDLIAKHILVKGNLSELTEDLKLRLISFKTNSYGFSGLMRKEQLNKDDSVQTEIPNLEDIMVYYNKGAAL